MTSREPTLGEIAEDLSEIKSILSNLPDHIARTYVRQDVYNARHDALRAAVDSAQLSMTKRIEELEASLKWAWRTAVTGLMLPMIVAVLTALIVALGR